MIVRSFVVSLSVGCVLPAYILTEKVSISKRAIIWDVCFILLKLLIMKISIKLSAATLNSNPNTKENLVTENKKSLGKDANIFTTGNQSTRK